MVDASSQPQLRFIKKNKMYKKTIVKTLKIRHIFFAFLSSSSVHTESHRTDGRVNVDLTYGRLTSELISLSVGSELTFYAVLDSFSARGHGKNCPVKIFEVYM